MSVRATPQASEAAAYEGYYDEERGYGWVLFAGVLLLMVGTLNTIEGIDMHAFKRAIWMVNAAGNNQVIGDLLGLLPNGAPDPVVNTQVPGSSCAQQNAPASGRSQCSRSVCALIQRSTTSRASARTAPREASNSSALESTLMARNSSRAPQQTEELNFASRSCSYSPGSGTSASRPAGPAHRRPWTARHR